MSEEEQIDRVYSDSAKEWQRRRAAERRRGDTGGDNMRQNYEPIVFPDAPACRHAALVVCALAKDAADAKLILEALALPTIMREGGDGRAARVQRTPFRGMLMLARQDPKPLGYGPDDYGRPEERRKGRR